MVRSEEERAGVGCAEEGGDGVMVELASGGEAEEESGV